MMEMTASMYCAFLKATRAHAFLPSLLSNNSSLCPSLQLLTTPVKET